MKVIHQPRQSGRTSELIKMCAAAEKAGHISCIVTRDQRTCSGIFQLSQDMNLIIGFPITYDEFLRYQYAGRNIMHFFIDDADVLLQRLSPVHIAAITLEEKR